MHYNQLRKEDPGVARHSGHGVYWSTLQLKVYRLVWQNQAIPSAAEFVLDGNLEELDRLTALAAQFCRENSLGEGAGFDLSLALEELFVNAVRHGGCLGMKDAVQVQMRLLDDGVLVEFADRGVPFDPSLVPAPDLTASLRDRPAGGFGLHLVRQFMTDFAYRRSGDWNRITMRRPLPGAAGKPYVAPDE